MAITKKGDFYVVNFDCLANADDQISKTIKLGTDFQLSKLTGTKTGACTLQINDSSTRQNLFEFPIIWDNIVGTAQLPAVWPMTYTFTENSTFIVTVTDTSGVANSGQLVLWGASFMRVPGGAV